MSEHSIIPPSSAHIWGAPQGCRGWVKMAELFPEDDETPEADEGNEAHELCAELLTSIVNGSTLPAFPENKEMINSALLYVSYIQGIIGSDVALENFGVEDKLDMPAVHPKASGTVDCWAIVGLTLHIFDFKYGFVTVEAYKNLQCIMYAAGILQYYTFVADVKIHIIQPRAPHSDGRIRSWGCTRNEADRLIAGLRDGAHVALSDQAQTTPGSHCKYCQARHGCESLFNASINAVEYAHAPGKYNLEPAGLSRELDLLYTAQAHIGFRLKALEAEAEALIRRGGHVPGYAFERSAGHGSRWLLEDDEVLKLGDLSGVDLRKISVLTPNQASGKGLDKKCVQSVSERKEGRTKLVKQSINHIKNKFGVV